jgi:hypothetical protein
VFVDLYPGLLKRAGAAPPFDPPLNDIFIFELLIFIFLNFT